MDKYKLVLDIIEHPENFTSEQLSEIMSDQETKEIYTLLCKVESSVAADMEIDINSEWENFSPGLPRHQRNRLLRFSSRAASIVITITVSIAVVAAGIAVKESLEKQKVNPVYAGSVTAGHNESGETDTIIAQSDSTIEGQSQIIFENESFEKIMDIVSQRYNIDVRFNNKEVANLHLFYILDCSLPLKEIVEQLNTFEQINIIQNGNVLNIN